MNKMIRLIGLLLVVAACSAAVAPPEQCSRTWKKVGCFHDRIIPDRPLPFEGLNHRDATNNNWDGHLLAWDKWVQSLHALACKCAEITRQRRHRYFGLQFYGECWTGPSPEYDRDGASTACIGVDYQPCNNIDQTECVGKAFTNYIYDTHLENKVPIPGGWSAWSSWSACTASCRGGAKERSRACTSPKPENGGKSCAGESVEEMPCNTQKCAPVCKNILDVGVITDASTSVTAKNYLKVKEFVVKLTEEFNVGKDEVHFGMIHYSWRAHLDFSFRQNECWNPVALRTKIMSSRYIYGGTRTDLALYKAEQELFCDSCGVRKGVPRVLIVITDGKSSAVSDPMAKATKRLKEEQDVTIISMGIGSAVDRDELIEIAEDESHVFISEDFDYMIDKLNEIAKLSCKANDYISGTI